MNNASETFYEEIQYLREKGKEQERELQKWIIDFNALVNNLAVALDYDLSKEIPLVSQIGQMLDQVKTLRVENQK